MKKISIKVILASTLLISAPIYVALSQADYVSSSSTTSSVSSSSSSVNVIKVISDASIPSLKYSRNDWATWIDKDLDCQNTRNEVLIEHTINQSTLVFKNKQHPCIVKEGEWVDPYSGQAFTVANQLDIDHVVPLKWAFEHGAYAWPKNKKIDFANDMSNLLPVSAKLNRSKGDRDPTLWLPPNIDFRCEYIIKFNVIVETYRLQYKNSEVATMDTLLSACEKKNIFSKIRN